MTGEFQNYRDKLADHIYLNQNGYGRYGKTTS